MFYMRPHLEVMRRLRASESRDALDVLVHQPMLTNFITNHSRASVNSINILVANIFGVSNLRFMQALFASWPKAPAAIVLKSENYECPQNPAPVCTSKTIQDIAADRKYHQFKEI